MTNFLMESSYQRHAAICNDSIRKNNVAPADPGCSGVPGFPHTFRLVYKSVLDFQ